MNVVFEPSLLFISDSDWYDEEKRDAFLTHLDNHLTAIDDYALCEILWTDALDLLMYETPQMHPWRQEYWAVMQIIPNIYKKLSSRTNYDFYCDELPCLVEPAFKNMITEHGAHNAFLKLVHTLIAFQEDFYLSVGVQNVLKSPDFYNFACDCHENQVTPTLINHGYDWLTYINVVETFFPRRIDDFENKFEKGLAVIRKKMFPDKDYLYDFEFTKNFKKSIVDRTTQEEAILVAVVKKLVSTSAEAKNSDLHDEFITKNKINEWRIRVTQRPTSTRIHYKIEDGVIRFLCYYGEGEHDDKL